jgi:hypothetical protein
MGGDDGSRLLEHARVSTPDKRTIPAPICWPVGSTICQRRVPPARTYGDDLPSILSTVPSMVVSAMS